MKSSITAQFRKLFAALPEPIQEQTRKAYQQLEKVSKKISTSIE